MPLPVNEVNEVDAVPARDNARDKVIHGLLDVYLAEGFLHLGIADLSRRLSCSRSTLYAVAPSKEQIITAVVRAFFRRATANVESRSAGAGTPRQRIASYLQAIADELRPAGLAFITDVEAFGPAREIYRRNTAAAAHRVQELVAQAPTTSTRLDPAFVGTVAGLVMEAIRRGDVTAETGLGDSDAYGALRDLLIAGLA